MKSSKVLFRNHKKRQQPLGYYLAFGISNYSSNDHGAQYNPINALEK